MKPANKLVARMVALTILAVTALTFGLIVANRHNADQVRCTPLGNRQADTRTL